MAGLKSILICARQLSVSSVRNAALVRPPVAVFGVEGRYATALYSAATKEKKLDSVEKELKTLKELIQKDSKFADFVFNPLLKSGTKKDALGAVLKQRNFSTITINLIGIMADNGRLKKLNSVVDSFSSIMSNLRGEVLCEVVSAKPLDEVMLKDLETTLKGFLKKDEKILLQTKVDPSLIGGMIVSVGDKYVDMSLATKIKTYSSLLRQSI